ncbi:hypothetical protein CA850_29685 [Micromonospora echinospora]|uniref:Uncharacterized protein n=1 Tax=Micromonospora echinospora TaxID=1877 RepID=A0A1C5ABK4_MICEC|nr:hypothetical protein [Micromonospora echinospora]OZV74752.1 hypothetical protein CA850_29685 [Micromonospora echinospora]SCF42461.1 hypothetical protein GA0070618_6663 [Micromonospora echinospora]
MSIRHTDRALTGTVNDGEVSTRLGFRPGVQIRAASLYFHPRTASGALSITDPAVAESLADELRRVAAYLRGEDVQ